VAYLKTPSQNFYEENVGIFSQLRSDISFRWRFVEYYGLLGYDTVYLYQRFGGRYHHLPQAAACSVIIQKSSWSPVPRIRYGTRGARH
jgi:hypothetical protein